MIKTQVKQQKRDRRHRRIRAKVSGTAERPRLAVFKSNRFLYAQLIDDTKGLTLAAVASAEGKPLREGALLAGKNLAKQAKEKGVSKVVFDRGGFSYLGAIKDFAEAARAGGLEF